MKNQCNYTNKKYGMIDYTVNNKTNKEEDFKLCLLSLKSKFRKNGIENLIVIFDYTRVYYCSVFKKIV